jgi:ribose 5-phosphate isomerase B
MKIALGADPFGLDLKERIKRHLQEHGHTVVDVGGSAGAERPYYEVAREVGRIVGRGELDRGILFCGSGMGMAILANKVKGVYAAVCEDVSAATNARAINNANVLALGGLVTAEARARQIVDAFLTTRFTNGMGELTPFLERSMGEIARIEDEEFGA